MQLESRNYLLAVRYSDGEIWLFEYDVVSSVGVQQMVGTLLVREDAAAEIGFAVRFITAHCVGGYHRRFDGSDVAAECHSNRRNAFLRVSDVGFVTGVGLVKDGSMMGKIKALVCRRYLKLMGCTTSCLYCCVGTPMHTSVSMTPNSPTVHTVW